MDAEQHRRRYPWKWRQCYICGGWFQPGKVQTRKTCGGNCAFVHYKKTRYNYLQTPDGAAHNRQDNKNFRERQKGR